ncbi:GL17261 [Drosophila persimilis]|uniref:GL17261 n=1 Tax=Drosophila persimilis TaxID=7234 RepID=B4GIS7_DROPE|nr:GL17261 [Drosophila persimilis]
MGSYNIVSGLALLLLLLLANNRLLTTATTDSEVVEAQAIDFNATQLNEGLPIEQPEHSPNGTMQVQPYNILEANCPHGYVLANKHCHKRVK